MSKGSHRRHSIRRAKERYNLDLSFEDYYELCNKIRKKKAVYLGVEFALNGELEHKIYRVCHNNTYMIAVYEPTNKCIITFLTLFMALKYWGEDLIFIDGFGIEHLYSIENDPIKEAKRKQGVERTKKARNRTLTDTERYDIVSRHLK